VTTRPRTRVLIVPLTSALAAITAAAVLPGLLRTVSPGQALPLRQAGELTLPGGSTRFDYESLDPGRGLLFIAHLGDQPDVPAYDPAASRLYVTAESGDLTILDNHGGHLTVTGRAGHKRKTAGRSDIQFRETGGCSGLRRRGSRWRTGSGSGSGTSGRGTARTGTRRCRRR
jgi:hypothetical protein